MAIRNAAKAIIIDNGKVLLNKSESPLDDLWYGMAKGDIYYDLPGGGQNQYESLEEAVVRECLEETGFTVTVERLAAIYEEIVQNAGFRAIYEHHAHKIYFIHICHLAAEARKKATELDLGMLGSEWIPIEDVCKLPFFPCVIKDNLLRIINAEKVIYLGSDRIP